MRRAGRPALFLLAQICSALLGAREGAGQDSTAVPRQLAIDTSRVRPFQHAYDMIVRRGDSTAVIGERDVTLASATYAGAPAWLLTETRTGLVPSSDSLFLSLQFRPVHWSSTQGLARLGLEFVGDSILGAVTAPMGKQNVLMRGGGALLPSSAFVDAVLTLIPLTFGWTDSVTVASVDVSSHALRAAEVAVIGDEALATDSATTRPVWVVALRSDSSHVLYWVDKDDASVLRVLQSLPTHIGGDLEFRIRPPPPVIPAP